MVLIIISHQERQEHLIDSDKFYSRFIVFRQRDLEPLWTEFDASQMLSYWITRMDSDSIEVLQPSVFSACACMEVRY